MGIVTAVISVVSAIGAIGAIGAGASVVGTMGVLSGALYGGASLIKSLSKKTSSTAQSPTYRFGSLLTQTNNQLPVAMIYGENKLAGNRLWQQLRSNNTVIDRIVAFGEGEIEAIEDVRLNDLPAENVKATVKTYLGTASQEVDDIIPGATLAEKIAKVGSLKHIAYASISLKASQKVSSDYNLTAVVKGRKVRVYSDLTNYTLKYSANPAWCLLDFLISYNGCAIGLNPDGTHDEQAIAEYIDIGAFIEAASYCDEQVNGAPRFAFNMIFDAQSQRRDIIEEFKKSCRGALVIKGKQLQLKIDKGSESVKTIDAEDIIADSERFWSSPLEENYDRIIVKYRSKEHDWSIVEAIAEKQQFENVPPIEHIVEIYSVYNHVQASALAWYYLNKAKLEKYFGYFETDYRAFDLEVGDVISLSENLMNFISKKVKIIKVVDKSDGTFGVFWREYNPDLYTDAMGSLAPSISITNLENIYEYPPDVQGFSAAQVFNTVQFSWQKQSEDLLSYEIREGESWELSRPLLKGLVGETANVPVFASGLKRYFIKSKSQYGVYSENALCEVLYIGDIPNMNLIFDKNLLEVLPNVNGGYIYQNQLKPTPATYWRGQDGSFWGDVSLGVEGLWASDVVSASTDFESKTYDIGACTQNLISMNYDLYAVGESTVVRLQWAYSEDGVNFCDWLNFCDGVYKFRYFKFKLDVQNPSSEPFMLSSVVANIDVPDRDEYYCDVEISNPNDGVTIDFADNAQSKCSQPFIVLPAVVANISGAQPAYCVVESKSLQAVTIKAYDYSGSPVSACLDVRVKGY